MTNIFKVLGYKVHYHHHRWAMININIHDVV